MTLGGISLGSIKVGWDRQSRAEEISEQTTKLYCGTRKNTDTERTPAHRSAVEEIAVRNAASHHRQREMLTAQLGEFPGRDVLLPVVAKDND